MVQQDWGTFVDSFTQPSSPKPRTTTVPLKDSTVENDVFFKVVLLGDEDIGKTALLYRYAKDYFPTDHKQTIVFDLDERKLRMFDNKVVKLLLLSHAGKESFIQQISSSLKDAVGFVLVYDVTNLESLQHCSSVWLPQINKHATNENCPIFLLGTKSDLREESTMDPTEVRRLTTLLKCRPMEVSAKKGSDSHINAIFEYITEVIYKRHLQNQIKPKTVTTPFENTKYGATESFISTTTYIGESDPAPVLDAENIGLTEIGAESDSEEAVVSDTINIGDSGDQPTYTEVTDESV